MNIVLITPTPPNIDAFGIRTISAILRANGYAVKTIFLPGGIEHLRFDARYIYRYSGKTLEKIGDLCRDADLIGFSLMSQYLDRAVQITQFLKQKYSTPIIWGGIHPTHRPEQCLQYCDIVCRGEGEYAICDLVRKMAQNDDYSNISGCWFKTEGFIKKNEPGPIVQNLDELPFTDYNLDQQYIYDRQSEDILPLNDDLMGQNFLRLQYFHHQYLPTYRTMTSRGCPHRCSYCASGAKLRLRRRSVGNVIAELQYILQKFACLKLISFFDDTFFSAPEAYFEEFRDEYKKKIGIPFHAQCSPETISERKLELLLDAGLFWTEMGIQTGSKRIMKMYRREISDEKIISAAALINQNRSRLLMPHYHVILDNPWETYQDVLDTLKLLLRIPGKFGLQISSLVLFPGCELNERAQKEGIIKDEVTEVCRKPFTHPRGTYLNYLIYLSGYPNIPRWLLKIMANKNLIRLFHRQNSQKIFKFLFNFSEKLQLLGKGIKALLKGNTKRISNYLRLTR